MKATITDIQLDKSKKIAIVGVEVSTGNKKYQKAFRIDPTQHINFETFRETLIAQVIEDLKNESDMDSNIEELTKKKGVPFVIDLPKSD